MFAAAGAGRVEPPRYDGGRPEPCDPRPRPRPVAGTPAERRGPARASGVGHSRTLRRSSGSRTRRARPARVNWLTSVLTVLGASCSAAAASETRTPRDRSMNPNNSIWAGGRTSSGRSRRMARRSVRRMGPITSSSSEGTSTSGPAVTCRHLAKFSSATELNQIDCGKRLAVEAITRMPFAWALESLLTLSIIPIYYINNSGSR